MEEYRKVLTQKCNLVSDLNRVYSFWIDSIVEIKYYAYYKKWIEEFIVIEWKGGGKSYANNNANSLSATARNVARMLDGGVYERVDYYENIMNSNEWERIV